MNKKKARVAVYFDTVEFAGGNMSKMNKLARYASVFAIITIIAVSSCSSGDDNNASGGIPTAPVAINASNAEFVVSQSSAASDQKDNAHSVVDKGNSLSSNTSANTAQTVTSVLKSLANRSGNITAMGLINCPISGTYTYPDETFGDYIYNNCTFYVGYTVDGSISITGTGVLGDGIWTSFNGSYSYYNLSITTGGGTYSYDGTMNIDYTNSAGVINGTQDIPSFTYSYDADTQIIITDEHKALIGLTFVELNRENIVESSIEVTNITNSQTYTESTDYVLVTIGNKTSIRRTVTGTIPDGSEVLIDYNYSPECKFFCDESVRLTDYLLDFYEAGAEGWFTYHYKLISTILGGSVYVETTDTFKYYTNNLYNYPYAGQITITGASNSKVRLTVKSGGLGLLTDLVIIDIDANGDDDYEVSYELEWQQIE